MCTCRRNVGVLPALCGANEEEEKEEEVMVEEEDEEEEENCDL